MSGFADASAAAANLLVQQGGNPGDMSGGAPEQPQVQQPVVPTPAPQVQQPVAPVTEQPGETAPVTVDPSESFTNVDPATLSPELQVIYKNMQAGFTRKTQEIAQLRQVQSQLESLGLSPDQIVAYATAAYRMETEPETAKRVAARINELYGGTGNQTPTTPQVQPSYSPDFSTDDDASDEYLTRIEQLEARLEMEARSREQEALARKIANDEQKIAQLNPDYKDEDWAAIYELMPSCGYDLYRSNERYVQIQAQVAQRLLAGRQQPNQSLSHPVGAIPTQPASEGPKTLREASEIAIARLQAGSAI